jgi:hypothetical protein
MSEESFEFVDLWIERMKNQLLEIEEAMPKKKSWRDLKKES